MILNMMKNSCSILLIQRIHFKNHYFKSECCHKYIAATQRGGCSVYSLPTNILLLCSEKTVKLYLPITIFTTPSSGDTL